MTSLPFTQVDAFADAPFTGNPAAVMPLDAWLDDATLQAIAAENNLSETAFTLATPDDPEADHALRWFTPTVEVKLCGHATLASGHVVLTALAPERETVSFSTRKAGILHVSRAADGYALSLPAYPPVSGAFDDAVALLGAVPEEVASHAGGYHVFRYADAETVRGLAPDFRGLARLGDLQFICTAPGDESDVMSRVFVPGAGVDEDSVTGSAHAALTPFWCDRLGREQFSAVQGSHRTGRLSCRREGDRAVLIGQCVTVVEGRFRF